MHDGVPANSQSGKMLEINLLNNFKLREETPANAKMQPVPMNKIKQATGSYAPTSCSEHAISKLKEVANNMRE